MNKSMTTTEHLQFEDLSITSVHLDPDGTYIFTLENGFFFWVNAERGIVPKAGQIARFYGRGIGFPVRGLDLGGQELFYQTPSGEQHRQSVERDIFRLGEPDLGEVI